MGKQVKKVTAYSAVFSPAEEGGYNVTFPDFPGCVTFGRNLREARKKAREVLELWLEELEETGEEIPGGNKRTILDQVSVSLSTG